MTTRIILAISLILMLGSLSAQSGYGAVQVIVEPYGASVSWTGPNGFLGNSSTLVYPFQNEHEIVWYGGVPGRFLNVHITKDGYMPIYQNVFVPCHSDYWEACIRPTVYKVQLQRQTQQYHYHNHYHNHYYQFHNHYYFCPPYPQAPSYYYFID